MNKRIIDFIEQQKVATICCLNEASNPYCFHCFYAFDVERELIYFKTSNNTHHATLLIQHPIIAGTIQPDKLNPLAIKGIQFSGTVIDPGENMDPNAASVYHKKYPFALAMPGKVYTILPDFIKMTDNTLSFGKKINWQRNVAEAIEPA